LGNLEDLSEEENAQLWAEEAARRDSHLDDDPDAARPAEEVFREARARIKRLIAMDSGG
jgi:hypothetical protein